MGDFRLPLRSDFSRNEGAKWLECCKCGAKRIKVLVHFDSGSVAPTVDETITGATSTDTFVVEGYTLISGTFAGGDAVGVIEGKTPTGYDDINLEVFQNDEALNGSVGGADMATVNGIGAVQISGRLIPDSDIIEYGGKDYCRAHFRFMFEREWENDARIDTKKEGDRDEN
jgi:hypothetical protein